MGLELKEINDRQKNLIPDLDNDTAVVIGVGGIGSWVALDLALVGYKTIFLFDPDTIESSNLNRTPFKYTDVDRFKVDAIEDLILERRPDVIVLKYYEYITTDHISDISSKADVFDCSDNLNQRDLFKKKNINNYIKFGYDGFSMTLIINDFNSGTWGSDQNSYRFIPSFFGAPQIISAVGIIELINSKVLKTKLTKTVTLDCREILQNQEIVTKVLINNNVSNNNNLLKKLENELDINRSN